MPTSAERSAHRLGVVLIGCAALCLASDGVLVKLSLRAGASTATAVIAKMAVAALGLTVVLAVLARAAPPAADGRTGLARLVPSWSGAAHIAGVAVMTAIVQLGFTLGFWLTKAANVLAFTSLAPIWGSVLARVALDEPLRARTLLASALALAGALVVAAGFSHAPTGAGGAPNVAVGAICLATGIAQAGQLVVIKSSITRAPGTEMLVGAVLGFALATLVGFALVPPLQPADVPLMPPARALVWLFLDGAGMAGALTFITLAGTRISPPEGALVLQLEALLGPILCFLVLREAPSTCTVAGGLIVVVAVCGHETASLLADSRQREPDDAVAGRTSPLLRM
ncbi:hypothetical protein KFE25_010530 [Diacronema lutheri]|uniref:EamA domain-containing protein n=1 Tax=Diacronema lutheri TaxID=2081491 RepID=A0A8J5X7W0_DIALT|nr:hypothetical protein KFE25_010530 [Diacronema lutheri]